MSILIQLGLQVFFLLQHLNFIAEAGCAYFSNFFQLQMFLLTLRRGTLKTINEA